jgi:predicted phage tail protein
MAVKQIYLHGILKQKFGEKYALDVQTPVEAVRALCCVIKDFKQEFAKHSYNVIKGALQRGWILDEETVNVQIAGDELHFIPVVAGSGGKSGLGQLITGVLLIGLAFTGVGVGLAGALGLTTTKLAIMGGILALGGLAKMNAKTPEFKMSSMEPADRRPSYVFTGAVNTTEQGNCIPLVFGRIRVGSQVVAQGMDTVNI